MKINMKKKKKKQFKPFDFRITFENIDELLAFITLMKNTEIQTWSKAPEITEILEEYYDGLESIK